MPRLFASPPGRSNTPGGSFSGTGDDRAFKESLAISARRGVAWRLAHPRRSEMERSRARSGLLGATLVAVSWVSLAQPGPAGAIRAGVAPSQFRTPGQTAPGPRSALWATVFDGSSHGHDQPFAGAVAPGGTKVVVT